MKYRYYRHNVSLIKPMAPHIFFYPLSTLPVSERHELNLIFAKVYIQFRYLVCYDDGDRFTDLFLMTELGTGHF